MIATLIVSPCLPAYSLPSNPAMPIRKKRMPSEALLRRILQACPANQVGVKTLARLSGKQFNTYFRAHVAELRRRGLIDCTRGHVTRTA